MCNAYDADTYKKKYVSINTSKYDSWYYTANDDNEAVERSTYNTINIGTYNVRARQTSLKLCEILHFNDFCQSHLVTFIVYGWWIFSAKPI